MGPKIRDREYTAKDYEEFNRRIHDQVDILKEVIARPEFGRGDNWMVLNSNCIWWTRRNVIDDMLQVANDGLSQLGVELAEKDKYLNII